MNDSPSSRNETLAVIQTCEKEKQALLEKQKAEEAFWEKNTSRREDGCDCTLRPWTVASNSLSPSRAVNSLPFCSGSLVD